MDALKFLQERSRMCKSYGACGGCPLEGAKCTLSSSTSNEDYEKIIAAVEQWSKEHPRKTRQSVFLEHWPAAKLDEHGVLVILPCLMNCTQYKTPGGLCVTGMRCTDCRKKFWLQEVE